MPSTALLEPFSAGLAGRRCGGCRCRSGRSRRRVTLLLLEVLDEVHVAGALRLVAGSSSDPSSSACRVPRWWVGAAAVGWRSGSRGQAGTGIRRSAAAADRAGAVPRGRAGGRARSVGRRVAGARLTMVVSRQGRSRNRLQQVLPARPRRAPSASSRMTTSRPLHQDAGDREPLPLAVGQHLVPARPSRRAARRGAARPTRRRHAP